MYYGGADGMHCCEWRKSYIARAAYMTVPSGIEAFRKTVTMPDLM